MKLKIIEILNCNLCPHSQKTCEPSAVNPNYTLMCTLKDKPIHAKYFPEWCPLDDK